MTVRVEGLKELRRALYELDPRLTKEMQKAARRVADIIAEGTREAFSSMAGSAPKVAPTVKAYGEQLRARVKVGGGSGVASEVAMGNLWGSDRFKQFPTRVADGYALYPTLKARNDEITEVYAAMLDPLLSKAFPK